MDDHLGSDPDGALLCDKISMQLSIFKIFHVFHRKLRDSAGT